MFAPVSDYFLDHKFEAMLYSDVQVPRLAFGLIVYLWLDRNSLKLPAGTRSLLKLYAYCFIPSVVLVFSGWVWVPEIRGLASVICFLVTGLLAEELIFRGALYELAEKVLPTRKIWIFSLPTLWTAALFGLNHFQYHDFKLTGPAAVQMSYTFLGGLYFGYLRDKFGSIWAPAGIHFLCNLLVVIKFAV